MIDTFSTFFFGHEVTKENQNIPFDEGSGEVNALIDIKSYTLSEFVTAIQTAMNAVSVTTVFTASVDRASGKITISGDGTFSLLVGTGSTVGSSAFDLMGFTGSSDLTASTSYTGDSRSGFRYDPQFKLQSFIGPDDFQESSQARVSETTSGRVEVVRFGLNKFIEFELKFITNLPMDGKVIKNNPTGLQDARRFLQDITKRTRFEFMEDIADPDTFFKVTLERIPGSSSGTGYRLRELFDQNLRDIFEIGPIRLRVVT